MTDQENGSRITETNLAAASHREPLAAAAEAAVARQAQEVQAAMVIAKRFPRDELNARNRIVKACQRQGLAESAMYSYPRGGTLVTGPSIRLAEAMAQNWGNIDFGIVELEQGDGESQVMSYAWDLETNSRQVRIFAVPHIRHTKNGSYKLTDPRDIYEYVANQGARRLRACILGIIPGDVQDEAVAQCESTLSKGGTEPLIDRVRKMVTAFDSIGIKQADLEGRLAHKLDATTEAELVSLRKVYKSIADGFAKREDFFNSNASKAADKVADAPKAPVEKPSTRTEPPPPETDQPDDPKMTADQDMQISDEIQRTGTKQEWVAEHVKAAGVKRYKDLSEKQASAILAELRDIPNKDEEAPAAVAAGPRRRFGG